MYLPRLKKTILRRDVRFEESRALRESLEREKVAVPEMEQLLAPNEEPQPARWQEGHTARCRAG